MIRALEFSVPAKQALEFGRATIRITWDGRKEASVVYRGPVFRHGNLLQP